MTSPQDTQRLEEIAKVLDARGEWPLSGSAKDDAAFLRDLKERLEVDHLELGKRLLGEEVIERATAKRFNDHIELAGLPEDPRWDELNDEEKAELRKDVREVVECIVATLPPERLEVGEGGPIACRNWIAEKHDNCNGPAKYIVWGKLFPKEYLGPRCEECAYDQVGYEALRPDAGYAIYHLPSPVSEGVEVGDAERIARAFHGVYETLGPEYGYESRPESRVPWAEVPEKNRALMVGTARRLIETGVIAAGQPQPHREEVADLQRFRYEGGDLDYEPADSAPADWDGDLGDLIGDYVRAEDAENLRHERNFWSWKCERRDKALAEFETREEALREALEAEAVQFAEYRERTLREQKAGESFARGKAEGLQIGIDVLKRLAGDCSDRRDHLARLLTRIETVKSADPGWSGPAHRALFDLAEEIEAALDSYPSPASGEGERLTLKVVVSGAPFEVGINRSQPASVLIEAALVGAGIKRRDDIGTWELRTNDGALLNTDAPLNVEDGATLFLDPEAGGGASAQPTSTGEGEEGPYAELSFRERQILEGRDRDVPYFDLAFRFQVSEERVRQIETQARQKLSATTKEPVAPEVGTVRLSRDAATRFLRHEDTFEDRTALKQAFAAHSPQPNQGPEDQPEGERDA